jgi:DNA-binding cell septation regulator SpoVG
VTEEFVSGPQEKYQSGNFKKIMVALKRSLRAEVEAKS